MQYDAEAMASLQIRELPEDVYQALAARARREGRSLAQQAIVELRRLPEVESKERRRAVLARISDRALEGTHRAMEDPVDLVREDRDA